MKFQQIAVLAFAVSALVACGGSSGTDGGTNTDGGSKVDAGTDAGTNNGTHDGTGYLIGGTVSGNMYDGLVLSTAGQPDLTLPYTEHSFSFYHRVATGTAYDVTVKASPSGQSCEVDMGETGSVAAVDVTTVHVQCSIVLP